MNIARLLTAGAFAGGLFAITSAAGTIYIEDDSGGFASITTGGVVHRIGTTMDVTGAPVVLGDIAVAPDGTVYGTGWSNTNLYKIDKTNAHLTLIGNIGFNPAGATFGKDGTLYADGGQNLFKLSLVNGAPTTIGLSNVFTDGDFAFNNAGKMFETANNGNLYGVDPTTGSVTFIGTPGPGFYGLTFDNGILYGFNFNNHLYTIDESTGVATDLGAYTGDRMSGTFGAASAPGVPGPAAVLPMALGALGILRRRFRKV